jgi:abortive infection bacteriophage resistance protein
MKSQKYEILHDADSLEVKRLKNKINYLLDLLNNKHPLSTKQLHALKNKKPTLKSKHGKTLRSKIMNETKDQKMQVN